MSTNVADLGWSGNDIAHRPNKVVLPLSDGNDVYEITVDGTNLRIWKINSSTGVATSLLNSNVGALMYPANTLSADVYSNNDIGVVFRRSNGELHFRRVTAAGSLGAAEVVASGF